MRYSLPFLLFSGLLMAFKVHATSIVPFTNLAELYAVSDAVVLVQAGTPYTTSATDATYNDCDFTVLLALKGSLAANEVFPLRQNSYSNTWARLDVPGDFVPLANHSYLLFLNKHDNAWRTMSFSYYVFEDLQSDNMHFLAPLKESLGIETYPRPDGTVAEPLTTYRRDALLQLLQQQNQQAKVPWDARAAQATLPAALAEVSDRALPTGCDFDLSLAINSTLTRWKSTFINVYYDVTNAPADALARVNGAIASLNAEYTGLHLTVVGTLDFSPTCGQGVAGINFYTFASSTYGPQTIVLFFEDPCNELTDAVNCTGTYGIGGSYAFGTTHLYKGDTWADATVGYAVINNGIRACLSETAYEQLLCHELTHALRMDHLPADPNANMFGTCCNAISAKDRECMNYVYDLTLPVELTTFDAKATKDAVNLTWTTAQEINNDYFIVERATRGLNFERLATVEASNAAHTSNYTLTDEQPNAGTNYYRLSQVDRDGQRKELGIRVVTYRGGLSDYTLVPNPASGTSIILNSSDTESNIGSLQIFNATGRMIYELPNSPQLQNNRLELPIGDLPAGVYWLKINESNSAETLKFVRL